MNAAAIDIGSNTVRMLLVHEHAGRQYFRNVTRLSGDFSPDGLLDHQSMARTLQALAGFSRIICQHNNVQVKAVGTEIFRRASNTASFLAQVKHQTGINIEVIDGATEATLSCRGMLSVLQPVPKRALLFDLGGGSTEIILLEDSQVCLQKSLPLGVIRLFEECPTDEFRDEFISQHFNSFVKNPIWQQWQQDNQPVDLVGTAGTVTTLAALKLRMVEYDGDSINNLILDRCWLDALVKTLSGLSLAERLALPGMEEGRADLILPGLQVVTSFLDLTRNDRLRVADAGLLEGLLLS